MSLVAGAVLLWQFVSTMSVGAQTVDILSPKPEPTVGASVAAVAPAPFIVPALPPMLLPEPVPVPPPVLEVPIAGNMIQSCSLLSVVKNPQEDTPD